MKRLLALVLVTVMSVSVLAGCKKKDDLSKDELGAIDDAIKNEQQVEETPPVVEEETKDVEYIIYVKYKDKPYLYDEFRSVKENDSRLKGKSLEQFVVEELASYEENGEFISAIPKGMKVAAVDVDGKNITVDLDASVMDANLSHTDAIVGIGSIVNTLIALDSGYKVQITVGGKVVDKISGVEIKEPLDFIEVLFPDK